MSLKALAEAVLARNPSRNACATGEKKPRNFLPSEVAQKLRAPAIAIAAEALPDAPLSSDLESLDRRAAAHYECPPDELELMLELARNDPEDALIYYRRLVSEQGVVRDPAAEARRQRVLAMLERDSTLRYALINDAESDPDEVIVTLAIRGFAECEFRIPKSKYDPFLLLRLIREHGTVH